jgi:hypothetical protein
MQPVRGKANNEQAVIAASGHRSPTFAFLYKLLEVPDEKI